MTVREIATNSTLVEIDNETKFVCKQNFSPASMWNCLHRLNIFKNFLDNSTDLSTLFTFSFLRPPMDPVMKGSRLFSVLPHSHVTKRRLAG